MTTQQVNTERVTDEQAVRNRRAFRLLFTLGIIVFIASTASLIRVWALNEYMYHPDLVEPGSGVIGGLIIIGASFFARRGNITVAVALIAIAFFIVDFFLMSRLSNVGLPLTIAITIGLILMASQALPPKHVVPGVGFIFFVGIVFVLLDMFWPAPRGLADLADIQIIYAAAVLLIIIGLIVALRQFSGLSLRTKLVSVAVTLVITTVFLTTILVNNFTRSALTHESDEEFQLVGELQAITVTELLDRQIQILEGLSLDSGLRTIMTTQNRGFYFSSTEEESLDKILMIAEDWPTNTNLQGVLSTNSVALTLRGIQGKYPNHTRLVIVDQRGALVGATYVPPTYYYGNEDWWQFVNDDDQGRVYIGEPKADEVTGQITLDIVVPIYDALDPSTLNGFVISNYSLIEMATLLQKTADIVETGHWDLIFGETSLHFAGQLRGLELTEFDETLLGRLKGSSGNIIAEAEGQPSLLGWAPLNTEGENAAIDNLGWSLVVSQAEAEAFATVRGQQKIAIIMALVAIVVGSAIAVYSAGYIADPINRLTDTAVVISKGNLNRRASVETEDEIGTLARAFNRMTDQLRESIGSLEDQVTERTKALTTSTEVSRQLSTIINMDELVSEVVNQIRNSFGYYHAQIYLYSADKEYLVMVGGTGDAGQQMLDAGHKLASGRGLVGRAAELNQTILIPDVTQDENWLANDLLPHTQSEAAVPIVLGDDVLGILDVQHNIAGGLDEEGVALLQSIANQVAIAIQNARLFTQSEERETLLRTIIDSTPDWVFVKDAEHRYLMVNQGYADALHISPDEFVGKNDLDLGFPEELVKGDPDKGIRGFWTDDRLVMDSGQMQVFPDDPATIDGVVHTFHTIKAPLRDADGQIWGVLAFARDITERKRVEEELREGEEQFRTILDSVPAAILITRLADGHVLYANEDLAKLFGGSVAALTDESAPDFYYNTADRQKVKEMLENDGFVRALELPVKRINGEQFWALLNVYPITFFGETALMGTFYDLSERKQAEQAVQASRAVAVEFQEKLRTLHEITLSLSQEDDLNVIFERVIEASRARLGLDRVGLWLFNPSVTQMYGAFGTNEKGEIVDVSHRRAPISKDSEGDWILPFIEDNQRYQVNEDANLYDDEGQLVGHGWQVIVILWHEDQPLGFLATDNLLLQKPMKSYEPDLVILLANALSNIIVDKRAEALRAKHARQLQTVAEVSRTTTTILDTTELLQRTVDLTKEQFGLYHAHIYLLNPNQDYLVLTAGAGDVGRMMVDEGRQIPLRSPQSLVAQAARSKQGVMVNDVHLDHAFLPNPLLPDTRSELATPIMVADEVLGVLDIQSSETNHFTQADLDIQTTLAAQIAVAMQNAAQYQQTQDALENVTRMQQLLVQDGWKSFIEDERHLIQGYRYERNNLQPIQQNEDIPVITGKADTAVLLPLTVRGANIGKLGVRDASGQPVPKAKQELLQSMTVQVAEALERARLFQQTEMARTQIEAALRETQRRTEELGAINTIVTELGASLDITQSMKIVVDGIAQNLGVEQCRIALLDDEGRTLTIVAEHFNSEKSSSALGMVIPVEGNTLTQEVMKTREPAFIQDVAKDPLVEPVRDMLQAQGIRSMVMLPMIVGSGVLGTVGIDLFEEGQQLTDEQMKLAQTIIFQAATAVQNAKLYSQTQKRAERERLVNTINQKIQGTTTVEDALQTAIEELGQALRAQKTRVALQLEKAEQKNGRNGTQ